jgi:DNA-binding transcriptional ArsR family regulator
MNLDAIFPALADPTRRGILDLLRERPRTTGDIAAGFPTTRFAVMKHLAVLEDAGLIAVRREGRERWNYLNAVPLQMLYERWVKRYEALWASKLTGLKSQIEGADMEQTQNDVARIERVELEIEIAAPRKRVWNALVKETTFWWPKNFYTWPKTKGFHMEPKLGGRVYEDWGNGNGLVWAVIHGVRAPEYLDMHGVMSPPYGPAHTILRLDLEEKGASTLLKLSDSTIGKVGACGDAGKEAGWKELYADNFKRYVESKQKKEKRK